MDNEEPTSNDTDPAKKLSPRKKTLALIAGVAAIVASIVLGRGNCRPAPKPPADAASAVIDAAPAPVVDAAPEADAAIVVDDAALSPAVDATP